MKVATIALVVLAAICVAEASRMDFETFKVRFNKQYASEKEHEHRRRIFEANKLIIRRQNIMSKTATFGVTKFADLTQEEFARFAKGTIVPEIDENTPRMEYADDVVKAIPDSFDWREKGAVTPVKNQGGCGSCWAFSTTGNIEGQHFISTGKLVSLSEQDLVDCDHECMTYEGQKSCDSGCNGGLQPNAYTYVMKNGGIASEESYPYQGVDGQCHYNSTMKAATISNFTMISTDEDQIAAALVNHGPLAIAADATEWQFYLGGVFDLPCGKTLDHGILIVGYGVHKGIFGTKKYWLIKNSWGTGWGKDGYLWLARGDGKCGMNKFVSTSII